jgi:acyl-CoA dehydrogenase
LQNPGSARDRLGHGQYLTRRKGSLFGDLEQTLENIVKVEPIFDKICASLGKKLPMTQLDKLAQQALVANIISDQEAELLIETEAGRLRTINVDDFDPQELIAANSNKVVKSVRKPAAKPARKAAAKPARKPVANPAGKQAAKPAPKGKTKVA